MQWPNYLSLTGAQSAGVPGELLGMWEAKQKFGNPRVTWASLFQPSIDMARNGIEIGYTMEKAMHFKEQFIREDPGLR